MYSKHRYLVLVLLFFAAMINYLDRSALSILAPYITDELGVNKAQLGIIFSSFAVGYALFCFIGGWLADRFGSSRVYASVMVIWSLFAALSGAVWNFLSLFIIRILFGAAEGPMGAVTNKTIVEWFPKEERARAIGTAFSGNPLGGAVAAPIVASLAIMVGWRWAFVGIGSLGIFWVICWFLVNKKKPYQLKSVSDATDEDQALSVTPPSVTPTEETQFPLSYYLTQPLIAFTAFAFFAYSYILFFFMSWFPMYLMDIRGLDIESMAVMNSLPWVIGSLGLISGGFVSDWIYKRTNNLLFSRKSIIVGGLIIAAISIVLSALVSSLMSAMVLMSMGMCAMYMTTSCYWAIVQDTVEGSNVGSVSGFIHLLANLAGIIAPMATGFIVHSTGQYITAFYIVGGLAMLSAILMLVYGKPLKKRESKPIRCYE